MISLKFLLEEGSLSIDSTFDDSNSKFSEEDEIMKNIKESYTLSLSQGKRGQIQTARFTPNDFRPRTTKNTNH